ncbi:MAG: hypothetical protein NW237_03615 [Cyanobacteriota bacterium]|nr:hypothetical protein [Cyanobacteriota bacterium]
MARNKGIIQLQGTVGGLTFKRDGTISQAVGSRPVTAERTKENNTEFAIAAKQAKVIRDALRGLDVGDRFLAGRMVKVVRSGVALDPDNERGKRILSNNEARQVLPKFELNGNANLTSVAPLAWVVAGDALTITKMGGGVLTPRDIYAPAGTTDISVMALVATVNLDPDVLSVVEAGMTAFPVVGNPGAAEWSVPLPEDPNLLTLGAVGVKFFQRVNGELYSLRNGSYDVAQIVVVR